MIADKITFPKGTKAILTPPRTIPATTFPIDQQPLDFTSKSIRWIDDPNGEVLTVFMPPLPGQIKIMGNGTKTAYNSEWQEQDARQALLTQLGLTAA